MPHARVPSRLAAVVAMVVAALAVSGLSAPAHAQTSSLWVAPNGSNTNAGTEAAPFLTLQKALDVVQPGATINLKAGTYREAVITKRAGTAAAPIKVRGAEPNRTDVVLYGLGGRVFSIDHSHYTIENFTINGQANIPLSEYQTRRTLSGLKEWKLERQSRAQNSKLIYVGASNTSADIVNTTISNMFLTGSGGECVRFRNRAANSLVVGSTIQWCGMLGQGVEPDQYKFHNAEGVYIGTSPKSTTQPMYQNDTSNNIVVRDSTIETFGSECFEVKENAHHNRMENVKCGFNDEPLEHQGSNVELRGDHNTVIRSQLYDSRSWNMKLASDTAADDLGGNTAQITDFKRAAAPAIVNRQTGSGPFCSDTFDGRVSEGNSIGNPTAACAGVDTAAPTVTTRTPTSGATNVAAGADVVATFSEPVQAVTDAMFTLKAGSATVTAPVSFDAATRTATLNPAADLTPGTVYTAALTDAVKDVAGNALAPLSWTFTTASAADTTAPTVTAQSPAANATGVATNANITATFSEAVQGHSTSTFTLRTGTTTVPAAVTYNAAGRVLTLDPSADLAASTAYTAELTSAVTDVAGNALAPVTWTFTTAAAAPTDTTAPTVTGRTPVNTTGVPVADNVTATFSEAVQGVGSSTFTLKPGTSSSASSVSAQVTYDAASRTVTLNPTSNLAANTQYTARLTGGTSAIRDAANIPLANVTWTFTTAAPADTTRPTVTSRNPSSGASSVSRTGNLTVTFSEAVNNVTPTTVVLRTGTSTSGSIVTAAVTRDGTSNRWILNPGPTLSSRTTYTVWLTDGITDAAGNRLAATSWRFTTGR